METKLKITSDKLYDVYKDIKAESVSNDEIYYRVGVMYNVSMTPRNKHLVRALQETLSKKGRLVNVSRGYWTIRNNV